MPNIIILNGPSCAGKSSIAREICTQTHHRYVHLQIDKVAEFMGTIFPKGFCFAENEPGTEHMDDGLQGLFNNNRFARRKVVASIFLATAKALLDQGFDVVMDTSLDGPDAQERADSYLDALKDYSVTFVGIDCLLEERIKRLQTRTDNLFLTEAFLRIQTDQYPVFALCQDRYDLTYDSSLFTPQHIAKAILVSL